MRWRPFPCTRVDQAYLPARKFLSLLFLHPSPLVVQQIRMRLPVWEWEEWDTHAPRGGEGKEKPWRPRSHWVQGEKKARKLEVYKSSNFSLQSYGWWRSISAWKLGIISPLKQIIFGHVNAENVLLKVLGVLVNWILQSTHCKLSPGSAQQQRGEIWPLFWKWQEDSPMLLPEVRKEEEVTEGEALSTDQTRLQSLSIRRKRTNSYFFGPFLSHTNRELIQVWGTEQKMDFLAWWRKNFSGYSILPHTWEKNHLWNNYTHARPHFIIGELPPRNFRKKSRRNRNFVGLHEKKRAASNSTKTGKVDIRKHTHSTPEGLFTVKSGQSVPSPQTELIGTNCYCLSFYDSFRFLLTFTYLFDEVRDLESNHDVDISSSTCVHATQYTGHFSHVSRQLKGIFQGDRGWVCKKWNRASSGWN